jgi:FtsP/CotA-like multicopper oxidase with cupredoxin domain
MNTTPRSLRRIALALAVAGLCWGTSQGIGAQTKGTPEEQAQKMRRMTPAERKAAAARAKEIRAAAAKKATRQTTVSGFATSLAAPLDAAIAPTPGGTPDYFGSYSNWANSPLPVGPIAAITITAGGEGYSAAPTVSISDVYGVGPTVTTTAVVVGGGIRAITVPSGNYAGPIVTISDATGAGATASATITPTSGGMRKFIDSVPDLKSFIATPDIVTYPGSDYYEIELVDYTNWSFHTDLSALGPTKLRGYRQTNNGTNVACLPACTLGDNTVTPPAQPNYLGPVIVATKDRPTRIKFTNNLAPGTAGDLFIPTDTTVMGAGMGPDGVTNYQQNRATLHLHGGLTPWVSDGTPHQWTVPAADIPFAKYATGVSTQPVPDMPVPAGGSMTFYYPNQQSGRLMFYHDHAYGTTRLNVYAGSAAGYLLRDATEVDLETRGIIPGLLDSYALVIQDKTFVWGTRTAATGTYATDPTWNWGATPGSLWFPHVYMPNQNPWDMSGANAMGRWDYALWFWPPYNGILKHETLPNPFAANPGEPPEVPGIPNPSLVPEAFMDTPVINGKAYPVLNVDPKAYRFRILNASNDRFWNLSLFLAADKTSPTTAGSAGTRLCNGSVPVANCTEVKMVPFNSSQNAITPFPSWWYTAGNSFSLDDRVGGVPDPTTVGPEMIQIGTEGGLLPAPVVIHNQPINYTYDRRNIVVLNVDQKALFLGPAERADVVVDFSQFAGKTLILYNDAPAPVPAADPRVDYFTGSPDMTDTGGAPPVQPGYGPNARTIMQINVSGAANGTAFDLTALQNAFKSTGTFGTDSFVPGAFAAAQDPIVVAQNAYNSTYNGSFPGGVGTPAAYARIQDTTMSFGTIDGRLLPGFSLEAKAIQELFELDYGRMNATLGVELPFTNSNNQTTVPLGYVDPPTEIFTDSIVPLTPVAHDGTQLWKITHNGVDTHAIHFHLFNVQVINRVGWDGAIRPPDGNELGWKETVRMNPLEDIIVAMRPTSPKLPFGLPDSIRAVAPALAPDAVINSYDPQTGNPTTYPNATINFGWEYVWHCHLLGHEENDMMRPMVFNVARALPTAPVLSMTGGGPSALVWTDSTPAASPTTQGNPANEIGFRVERAPAPLGAFEVVARVPANSTTFTDPASVGSVQYRVVAFNAAGEVASNIVSVGTPLSVTLTADHAAPQAPGTSITFAAAATGGVAPIQFKWFLYDGSTWTVLQEWSTTATFVWTPATANGLYSLQAWARNAGNEADRAEQFAGASFPILPSGVSAVSVTADQTAPQAPGTSITFTAAAIGGVAPIQFKWYLYDGSTWTVLQDWSATATLVWTPATANGLYSLQVWARGAGNEADRAEQFAGASFPILASGVSAVTVSADHTRPQAPGTTVTFTAAAAGGAGPIQFKWYLYDGSTWTVLQEWSTATTFVWTPATANGAYSLQVWARSAGNTANAAERVFGVAFPIAP